MYKKYINLTNCVVICIVYLIITAVLCKITTSIVGMICSSILVVVLFLIFKNKLVLESKIIYRYELLQIGLCFLLLVILLSCINTFIISNQIDANNLNNYNKVFKNSNIVLVLLYSVVLAPISEEIIFRGIIYRLLKNTYSILCACIISSVLFAVAHMTIAHIFAAVAIGIFLCVVYERTNRLIYTIILHMSYNIITLCLNLVEYSINNVVAVVCCLSTICLLIFSYKSILGVRK